MTITTRQHEIDRDRKLRDFYRTLYRTVRMDLPDSQSDNQDRLAQLRSDLEKAREELRAMCDNRRAADFSAEEIARAEELDERCDFLEGQIESRERIQRRAFAASDSGDIAPARRSRPADGGEPPPAPRSHSHLDPTGGFSHLGEFSRAVMAASGQHPQLDERLARMAPTSVSVEGAGPDGGYLVPPEFSQQIMEYVGAQNSIYAMVDKTPVNHSLMYPVDQEAPWSTNGPLAFWDGEAEQITQSKVKLRTASMRLNKITCLCPVSDELMEDAPQLGTYLRSVMEKKIRWKLDYGIFHGTGAGMPLGILNSPALKTVAKEGGQSADTINSDNIKKMWQALFGDYRGNAVWFSNQDCETQLLGLVVAGSLSDTPVWLPSGSGFSSFAGSPHTVILGRPHVPHQALNTLGDKGDIVFADMQQYVCGFKTMGPGFSESIHLWFDWNLVAVKAVWRITGMPKWSTTIPAANGSATYSPFVTLAERSS